MFDEEGGAPFLSDTPPCFLPIASARSSHVPARSPVGLSPQPPDGFSVPFYSPQQQSEYRNGGLEAQAPQLQHNQTFMYSGGVARDAIHEGAPITRPTSSASRFRFPKGDEQNQYCTKLLELARTGEVGVYGSFLGNI